MAQNIIRASELDVSKLTFSDVKTLDNGGKIVNVSYSGQRLFMQLPALVANYGLSVWPAEKTGGFDKMQLDLSLKGYDSDVSPSVKAFYNNLQQFDEKMIDTAMQNSKMWLRKAGTSREVIQAVYTPLIKYAKDKDTGEISNKYPPTVRLQIPRNRAGDIDIEVYDAFRKRVDFDAVNFKRAQVTAIVQISSVWIISGKFGITMKVHQMKVNPDSQGLQGYAFIPDEDDPAPIEA